MEICSFDCPGCENHGALIDQQNQELVTLKRELDRARAALEIASGWIWSQKHEERFEIIKQIERELGGKSPAAWYYRGTKD